MPETEYTLCSYHIEGYRHALEKMLKFADKAEAVKAAKKIAALCAPPGSEPQPEPKLPRSISVAGSPRTILRYNIDNADSSYVITLDELRHIY